MRPWIRVALLLAVTSAAGGTPAAAQQAVTLKFSWDHCSADGQVSDRSFACNTNSGSESIYASMVIDDGVERGDVGGFMAYVDVTTTAASLPTWWQTIPGLCRANAIGVQVGSFAAGGSCTPWYAPSGIDSPIGVFATQPGKEGPANLRLALGATVPAGSEVTLPAGQELLLFRVIITHAKSAGTDACAGCTAPTCIGFGYLNLQFAGSTPPDEDHLGSPASAVTWQGAYVSSYQPVAPWMDYAWHDYHGNLACATGPVPAQGRTWGLIKTMYR